ncbi:hypothetical protein [Lysinibacillus sp. Ag94]|uniref:hypothetical protein n=1 Tax=Lysinibacillus sp. Ag94 TaxID=2936682 RepID=UPI00200E7788|nr:hypothetical protein [Lysinibacillus sp. Ag94]UPW85046.1 hypothetical protein MY533_09455 [Lysinibacillus sp. Ag94]
MVNFFNKYSKYIALLIFIFEIIYFGIPDYVKPVFVYEYLIFFGLSYLFAIIQDFFNPSEKTDILLRVVIIMSSLVILLTSIYYKATFSLIFSMIMFSAISFTLYLAIKHNKMNKQQDY